MQMINALVARGGDRGMSIPKTNIPVSEVPVLQAIHGDDAVYDVRPAAVDANYDIGGEVERLAAAYKGRDEEGKPHVAKVYAGFNADVPTTLKQLRLPADAFAVKSRVTIDDAEAAPEDIMAGEGPVKGDKADALLSALMTRIDDEMPIDSEQIARLPVAKRKIVDAAIEEAEKKAEADAEAAKAVAPVDPTA